MNSPKKLDEQMSLIEFNKESIIKSSIFLIVLSVFYLSLGLILSSSYLGWFYLLDSLFHLVPGVLAFHSMRKEKYHYLKIYQKILLSLVIFSLIMVVMLIVTICYIMIFPRKCAKQQIEACKVMKELDFLVLIACFLSLLISLGTSSMIFSFYRRVNRFLDESPSIKFTPISVVSNN